LSNEILDFSNKYKHKQKKTRRSSAQDEDMLTVPRFEGRVKSTSDRPNDDEDEYSIAFDRSYGEDDSSYEMR